MDALLRLALFVPAAYLAGSVNAALVLGRLLGRADVRQSGSGNPGTINALRVLGRGWALLVLLFDAGRGVLVAIVAGRLLSGGWVVGAGCLAVLVGNLWPVFHGFRGGKGVATSLGLLLGFDPLVGGIGVALWLGVVAVSRLASLGSLVMALAWPVGLALHREPAWMVALGVVVALVLFWTHRANLARLIRGQEPQIGSPAR